ncbi:MAG TPA: hypothetical protein VMS98_01640 [Thermoanaerobaculia bacterium]|nr:hypothetical protein [Thermoanaerobaculia bacterium]
MKKCLLALFLLSPLPTQAQDWSVGVGSGPFVFGDFVRRTMQLATEEGSATQTLTLSAATRAGLGVDIERRLSGRFAIRAEGTFTRAPLVIKGNDGDGVSLQAGDIDIATFSLPLVIAINRGGSFRFHVRGGPAYAAYRVHRRQNAPGTIGLFDGTRGEWGLAFGGGVAWQWTDYFAIEGGISDVATASPFERSDFSGFGAIELPRPHNVHTTIGIRYRF